MSIEERDPARQLEFLAQSAQGAVNDGQGTGAVERAVRCGMRFLNECQEPAAASLPFRSGRAVARAERAIAGPDDRPQITDHGPRTTGDEWSGFPGYLRDCITVGATDRDDQRAGFSNSGPQLDLVAPGVNIATVGLSGELEYARGTSFSAPMVAGTCALMAALRPQLTSAEATLLLCAGAEDEVGDASDTPGFDTPYGWGRLNVFHSLMLAALRIDRVRLANGGIELSWASPADAMDKGHFIVEFADSPGGAWTPLTDPGAFSHAANRVTWIDHGVQAGNPEQTRFYRVRLRL